MKLFALGDLHLSLKQQFHIEDKTTYDSYKPMDIFGEGWANHTQRIWENWEAVVGSEDVVLIPGDISWAMHLKDTHWDFDFIHRLPGKKILLRGNHDYWWHSPAKIREVLPGSMEILQNQAICLEDVAICGTRLWSLPETSDFKAGDQKILDRELIRLELSLEDAKGLPSIVMFHYMPVNERCERNQVTELLQHYDVKTVIYGHLHDKSHRIAIEGNQDGIDFHLVSGDYLDFTPKLIKEI